jgi:hypothetical protein
VDAVGGKTSPGKSVLSALTAGNDITIQPVTVRAITKANNIM